MIDLSKMNVEQLGEHLNDSVDKAMKGVNALNIDGLGTECLDLINGARNGTLTADDVTKIGVQLSKKYGR